MIAYYFTMAVLALVNLLAMTLYYESRKVASNFTLITLLMALSNAGYLALALSGNISEAVLANKVGYISGCFVPPIFLFSICAICNYNIPNWFRNLLLAYSFIVYALVLTIGYSGVYYSDISLGKLGDAATLLHEYGPGHNLFYVILYGYIIAEVILLLYCLKKKRSVSRKNLYAMILMETMNTVLFLVSRVLSPGFEIMPVLYVVDGWVALYLYRRLMIYNVEDSALSSAGKQELLGYILFDNSKCFIGANRAAQEVFPCIRDCEVDRRIDSVPGAEVLLSWLAAYSTSMVETFYHASGERHYQCDLGRIWRRDRPCGYIIQIQEDTDRWNYINLLSSYNTRLEEQVREKTDHIMAIQSQVLSGMANIVENRDGSTGGHIKRTSDVIRILLDTIRQEQILPIDETFEKDIVRAAPMHDLGKISIDDRILKKPDQLTAEEFAIMQTHAEKSARLVESILQGVEEDHFVRVAVNVARYHHEKWDGSGYPERLKGEAIPIEARIMAIADVYDALVSRRCYKGSMDFDAAFQVMQRSMGVHFDPGLEQVLVLSRDRLENYYRQTAPLSGR